MPYRWPNDEIDYTAETEKTGKQKVLLPKADNGNQNRK